MSIPQHHPQGNPCALCGKHTFSHRVNHRIDGNPCKCGLPDRCHLTKELKPYSKTEPFFVGIDGEGRGREVHHYIMLAASDELGERKWSTEPVVDALSTIECLDFILNLPSNARIFSYGFNYDLTKMLQDLPDNKLFSLFRPELRPNRKAPMRGPTCIIWKGYRLNLQGTKFSVRKNGQSRIVWDILKFYQSTFVNALRNWKVGEPKTLDFIDSMKKKRNEFDKEDRSNILEYCWQECRYLAQLAHKLIEAHGNAGLELKNFYGAGTTGGLILEKMGIRDRKRDTPKEMELPVAQAFFGGRFEHSVIGAIEPPIWSYDISSAYPYQCRFLPCLDHGKWRLTKKQSDLESSRAALVHYSLGNPKIEQRWAPFPHRDSDGNICFPTKSGGGWIYKDEFEFGQRVFPYVQFIEAYILESNCDCVPFRLIPEFYKERVRIGKEGAGIVLKLGPNSVYGKLAQSVGSPRYQCWLWAGMITSGCRAQILQLMGLHKNLDNILAIATDGVYTREKIDTPIPFDTGTFEKDLIDDSGKSVNKPLGGWEEKEIKGNGVFFARPGIYFESGMNIQELKSLVRARGMGRASLVEHAKTIINAWRTGEDGFTLPKQLDRFCGAKTSTHMKGQTVIRSERYGQWVKQPITLSFNPFPKRSAIIRLEGKEYGLLSMRGGRQRFDGKTYDLMQSSQPYKRAIHSRSKDAIELKTAQLELFEQPDAEHVEYENEVGA